MTDALLSAEDGPEISYTSSRTHSIGASAIDACRTLLKQGRILAIKGIGGFHLACDATNPEAVLELRRRKGRIDKPFALMARNIEEIRLFCEVGLVEERLLLSSQRPIVLLQKKPSPLPRHMRSS